MDLIRREGDEENMNAIWMNEMEYLALRACTRSEMVEGEGVRLEDGKLLQMEKGKTEMDNVTGVKAAYIRKTRQVLNLIIPGTEKEGMTHVYLVCRWYARAVSDRVSSRWASPRWALILALLRGPYR